MIKEALKRTFTPGLRKIDIDTTIQELKDLVIKFSNDRNWQRHHTPKNLAMGMTIEAAELMELYQWERAGKPDPEEVADELADIVFRVLNFAQTENLDIVTSFMHKYQKILKKYPVEKFNKKANNLNEYRKIKKTYLRGRQL